MKSKVLLFCVLLFCSKIVDSIPHSEDHNGQRAWNVNQNVQNRQNHGTDFIQTRNVNIPQEEIQDYTNNGGYNYDNNGYNKSPPSSAGQELLGSYDSSKVGFDNQQYRNQNWPSHNQYTNSDSSLIPDDERPLVPVQYLQPQYGSNLHSPSNQRFYQPGRFNQFQPLTVERKYVENSPPLFGSRNVANIPYHTYSKEQVSAFQSKERPGVLRYLQSNVAQPGIIRDKGPAVIAADILKGQSEHFENAENHRLHSDLNNKARNDAVLYEKYGESQATASEVKSRAIEDRYAQSFEPQFGGIYHKAPAVGATDTLKNQPENIKSRSHLSNIALITNHDDRSPLISESDHKNSEYIPSNLAHVNYKKEIKTPVEISQSLLEMPAGRYANNYGSHSGWNNVVQDDSSNGVTETVAVESGKYEANHKSDHGLKDLVPINTYPVAYPALNKYEDNPTTLNINPEQNVFQRDFPGIKEHNLGKVAANPANKRFVIFHPNGTVEYLNELDINSLQYSKLRLRQEYTKLPEKLVKQIAKTTVPVNGDKLPTNNQPADVKEPKPLHEDQANRAYDSNMSPPLKDLPVGHSKLKALPQSEKQPAAKNSKSLPSYVIPPAGDDNSKPLIPNEVRQSRNQSEQNDNLKPLPQDVNQSRYDYDSQPLTPHVNQSAADGNSKPLPQDENQSVDDDKSKQLVQNKDQPKDKNNSTRLFPNKGESAHVEKPNHSYLKHLPHDFQDNSKPLPTNENQPDHDRPFRHHRKHSSKYSNVNKPAEDNNSNLSTTPKLLTHPESQQGDDNYFKSLPAHATQSANDKKSKPSHGDQGGDDINSTPSSPHENQPEQDNKSKPLHQNKNQLTDDIKSKPTPAIANNNDDQSYSTTVSTTEPNYTTSTEPQVIKMHNHNHIHPTSTTESPVVSTTTCSDDTSKDQIITLSPIEQATDNVSDVPPVATTTMTTRPVKSKISSTSDISNDANNKKDDEQDNTAQTYSTTTATPSSSASPTDIISDDKTIGNIENKNTETNDTTVVEQDIGEKDTHTAVYNSSELFDTNTDVPAESDDYSSVTASPSVQNDVNTGDASGDNALELGYSETDVTITVSSNTANDFEDEIITINIEVSESTDDADLPNSDKTLVVNINTNNGSDDDSKTPKPEDWKKNHNSNDGRGNNVEIDMSNLKGEPTMLIRTTNQDFIDKLMAKNDTEFDVIYFFHIENQPAIEREKATTIYCNGTVVTETTEITYAHKDDPTPTIVKTTKITQNDD